jgi:cysteine sulfinate desulfinase/cysteine desulfurase-like protein
VLSSIGLSKDEIGGTIRVSLGAFNTEEEIRYFLEVLEEEVSKLK